jgi:hypothetical protein
MYRMGGRLLGLGIGHLLLYAACRKLALLGFAGCRACRLRDLRP